MREGRISERSIFGVPISDLEMREALDEGRLAAFRVRFKADRSVGVG